MAERPKGVADELGAERAPELGPRRREIDHGVGSVRILGDAEPPPARCSGQRIGQHPAGVERSEVQHLGGGHQVLHRRHGDLATEGERPVGCVGVDTGRPLPQEAPGPSHRNDGRHLVTHPQGVDTRGRPVGAERPPIHPVLHRVSGRRGLRSIGELSPLVAEHLDSGLDVQLDPPGEIRRVRHQQRAPAERTPGQRVISRGAEGA